MSDPVTSQATGGGSPIPPDPGAVHVPADMDDSAGRCGAINIAFLSKNPDRVTCVACLRSLCHAAWDTAGRQATEIDRLRGLIEEAASVGVHSNPRLYVEAIVKLAKAVDWPWTLKRRTP